MRIVTYRTRRWGRWLGTFIGFPLAGVTTRLVVGNVDSTLDAVVGGAAGGAVLGAVQAIVGGIERADRWRWTATTAIGLSVGLGAGARAVGFDTDVASLVQMGAVSGLAVGIAQALSVPARPIDRVVWAIATPALWALGWLVTSQVIVDADRQHAVFGSSGALMVSAVAGVLYAARPPAPARAAGALRTSSGQAVAR